MVHYYNRDMSRRTAEDRFDQLIECTTQMFMQRGFRHTQIDEVARKMGVAPGTIYRYVESKDALFDLVLEHALAESPLARPTDLPYPTPPPGAILARVRQAWAEMEMPVISSALDRERAADIHAEFRGIIDEMYDRVVERRIALKIIEKSALELPGLEDVFYREIRRHILRRLTDYLDLRIRQQQIRPVPDPATSSRFILESIAWFALHRPGDPDSAEITDQLARETVLDALEHAFVLK